MEGVSYFKEEATSRNDFIFKSCSICFLFVLVDLFLKGFFELHVPDFFYVTFAHQR